MRLQSLSCRLLAILSVVCSLVSVPSYRQFPLSAGKRHASLSGYSLPCLPRDCRLPALGVSPARTGKPCAGLGVLCASGVSANITF